MAVLESAEAVFGLHWLVARDFERGCKLLIGTLCRGAGNASKSMSQSPSDHLMQTVTGVRTKLRLGPPVSRERGLPACMDRPRAASPRSREAHGPSKAAIPGIPCSQPELRAQSGTVRNAVGLISEDERR